MRREKHRTDRSAVFLLAAAVALQAAAAHSARVPTWSSHVLDKRSAAPRLLARERQARALPFRERQARAALRADLHTPAAAAASPLPPSIPLQFRGRACARTHHCLFLGFRIRKRALGFRKRAFCPFPRKTCAQAMQCRTSHPSSMGMCRAARLLSLRGGGALDITTTCDQTQMGECVGAYACSVCACTI